MLLETVGKLFTNALPWVQAGVGLLSTVKGYQSAKAVEKEGRYNADLWRDEAAAAWKSYEDRQNILRHEQRLFQGTQVASYGKSGVTMAGSPMDVLADTAYRQDLDRTALYNQAVADRHQKMASANLAEFQSRQTGSSLRSQSLATFGSTVLGSGLLRNEKGAVDSTTAEGDPPKQAKYTRKQANAVAGSGGWRPLA